MSFRNKQGGALITAMAVYVVAKAVLNMVLAGHFSLSGLLIALAEAAAFFLWFRYVNYVLAAMLAFFAFIYLPQNIANIGSNWIYLLEGVLDMGCAALLCFSSNVREHYSNQWNNKN